MTSSLPPLALLAAAALIACSGAPSSPIDPAPGDPATPFDAGSAAPSPPRPGAPDGAPDPGNPAPDGGSSLADGATSNADAGRDSGARPVTDYAPYFFTWSWGNGTGYAFKDLADLRAKSGLDEVTLAFVLSGGGCTADQGVEGHLADVKAFVAAGGHLKASFGGADGTYVESQCSDASSLAKAIGDFVDATGITDLDFDIEQDPVMNAAIDALRGQALKKVQDAKGIQVSFTLAANPHASGSPGGLTDAGRAVVSAALAAGVVVSHVNLMVMDFGASFQGQPMAPIAIGSLTDANAQLMAMIPGLTKAQAWAMLGATPMIGKNDDGEIFTLADAKSLAKFAKDSALGLVSFWAINRDQVCANVNDCTTVNKVAFEFNAALRP